MSEVIKQFIILHNESARITKMLLKMFNKNIRLLCEHHRKKDTHHLCKHPSGKLGCSIEMCPLTQSKSELAIQVVEIRASGYCDKCPNEKDPHCLECW
jgi:hypothetical protein